MTIMLLRAPRGRHRRPRFASLAITCIHALIQFFLIINFCSQNSTWFIINQFLSWAIYFSCEARKNSEAYYKRTGENARKLFHQYVLLSEFCLWHNFVYGSVRELWKLATCGLRQYVGISSLQKSFISNFENPFRKTSERKNSQISVIFSWIQSIYRH